MSQMNAKYAGTCRKCGGVIYPGDLIEWTRDSGARHVTCPVNTTPRTPPRGCPTGVLPKSIPAPVLKTLPVLSPELAAEQVTLYFSDGEYLSGWVASCSEAASKHLEALGLHHYVSGWGNSFDNKAAEALCGNTLVHTGSYGRDGTGGPFTMQAADDYARPAVEAKFLAEYNAKLARLDKRAAAFVEAATTGKPVVLHSWNEDCDQSVEECDIDNVTEYALPDGSTKTSRSHSY